MTVPVPADLSQAHKGWDASLELGFSPKRERTVLSTFRHRGPLTVQRPFYPEGSPCHVYVLHPPGGVVGGDSLEISATVSRDGHGLITTPGAGKFYRSSGLEATVRQNLNVSSDGILEWFPQETLIFNGAHCNIQTHIDLEQGARFMGWDITCFGRPASSDFFEEGRIANRLKVSREGVPLLIEGLRIKNGEDMLRPSGQRGFIVNATFFASGCSEKTLEKTRGSLHVNKEILCGVTLLDDLMIIRYLGNSVEEARNIFLQAWQRIRPVTIGLEACPPRIWST